MVHLIIHGNVFAYVHTKAIKHNPWDIVRTIKTSVKRETYAYMKDDNILFNFLFHLNIQECHCTTSGLVKIRNKNLDSTRTTLFTNTGIVKAYKCTC